MQRRELLGTLAGLTAAGLAGTAWAQGDATRIVVGFAPGGGADNTARLYANKATNTVVENRPGAGGRLAAEVVRAAPADGRTLLVTPDPVITLYPHVFRKLAYDPMQDFRAVSQMVTSAMALAVGPMVPASVRNLNDFAAWCKANPDKASYGTAGTGSPLHFLGALIGRTNGFAFTHVPFKGGILASQDVAAGQIASSVNVLGELAALVPSGKVRLLGVTGSSRSRFLPDVPTFLEQGMKDTDFGAWFGMFAPARTPDRVVQALQAAVKQAYSAPEVRETLNKLFMEGPASTPEELTAIVKADSARWGPVVAASGYTPES
ncbi:tripartite tricarboxylate transporter substrate-binding protein [Aquabacterium sp. J223]|uniref:tripartite tricarboxylate transporter substrate-binding protein n=1 Tax=Aquabacterium sp. J223 TaxID=2898431 RepID=UPI0021ADC819|nr:tripartite tricarboxylate transporter substrate-binding protein [Aquabacterium sp. J223]UUX97235.1 twin-arginine translocation pathway signal protein [Aquabacterium sp. J223]